MFPQLRIFIAISASLLLLLINLTDIKACPDTLKVSSPDTAISTPFSASDKIDTLINKNEPPIFINKFSKFKRLFDKIITADGDTLTVLINKVTVSSIEFNFPLNHRKEILDKKLAKSLIYSDGTSEIFPPPAGMKSEKPLEIKAEKTNQAKYSEKDWDKVVVLNSLDEASGAQDLGEVESKFEGDRITNNSAYLEKSAMIILKKKVAQLGANLIFISKKDEYRPYGDLPSISIMARAFYKP